MAVKEITIKQIDNGYLVAAEYPYDSDKEDTTNFYKTKTKALAVVAQILGVAEEDEDDQE